MTKHSSLLRLFIFIVLFFCLQGLSCAEQEEEFRIDLQPLVGHHTPTERQIAIPINTGKTFDYVNSVTIVLKGKANAGVDASEKTCGRGGRRNSLNRREPALIFSLTLSSMEPETPPKLGPVMRIGPLDGIFDLRQRFSSTVNGLPALTFLHDGRAMLILTWWSSNCPGTNQSLDVEKAYLVVEYGMDLKEKYFHIWRNILQRISALNDGVFMRHIRSNGIHLSTTDDHWEALTEVTVVIDWFQVSSMDHFPIRLPDSDNFRRGLLMRRNTYLDEDEIIKLLPELGHITKVHISGPLRYSTRKDAVAALTRLLGVREIKEETIHLYISREGQPSITGSVVLDAKANRCMSGSIALITGEMKTDVHSCWVD
jgi:hypothetical protein